jgi:hypothetical protein
LATDAFSNLDPAFADSLKRLIAASGGKVSIFSGYRTPQRQAQLFSQAVQKYGSPEAARKYVAPPGKSYHNKGQAADLRGDLTTAHKLAAQFGLNFPMAYEKWHVEPIGARNTVRKGAQSGVPALTYPQPGPNLGQNAGNVGLEDVIAAFLAQANRPSRSDIPALYNPLSPTPQVNPAYDPALVGPQQPPPTTLTGPSDLQAKQSEARAGLDPTNPYLQQADREKALADFYKARAAILKTHPAATQTVPAETPLPNLPQAQIPQRQQPRLDPAAAILSALAGAIAPQFAGQFGAQPLQAGVQAADTAYQDQLRQYQLTQQQLMAQYEHDLAQHNETRKNALYGSEVDYNNRRQQVEDARAAALEAAQGQMSGTLAGSLAQTGAAEAAAAQHRQTAAELGERINYGLGQNASTLAAYSDANKQQNEVYKTLLPVLQHLQTAKESNQTRRDVARETAAAANARAQLTQTGENARSAARIASANARSAASIASREKIAAQKAQVDKTDTSKYSPQDQHNVDSWKQAYNTALHAETVATNQAIKEYPVSAEKQAGMSLDTFIDNRTARLKAVLKLQFDSWQQARQEAEAHLKAKGKPTGGGTGRMLRYDPATGTLK